jgi:hypothetical protein
MAHWVWYAPSVAWSFATLLPLLVIYTLLTPQTVRAYAMVMSLGKPDTHALSETILYMEQSFQALHQVRSLLPRRPLFLNRLAHQVAELLVSCMSEDETLGTLRHSRTVKRHSLFHCPDDVFRDWDVSGDGELSFKEVGALLQLPRSQINPPAGACLALHSSNGRCATPTCTCRPTF